MAQAQENEKSVGITKGELQEMLAAVARAVKEPSVLEQKKLDEAQAVILRKARDAAEMAKQHEVQAVNKWHGCPHSVNYNGRLFNRWCGQVNSDGFVHPVCNLCHVEAPPFSAMLLPDQGKNGVNFEQWIDASKERLAGLHKTTFPSGCGIAQCFLCNQKQ